MASAPVDIPVKVKGLSDLQKLESRMKALEKEVTRLTAKLPQVGSAARTASSGVQTLNAAFAKITVVIGAVTAAIGLFNAGIERTESERRIKLIADSYGEASQLAAVAAASAEKFGQSQTEANNALATTYARLRPVGVGLAEIESVYNGFNTAARLAGADAQESAGAFRQLAQALGSGALRGDEFNSIAEQAPGVLQAISKETGVAVGDLRDFAADGLITSDIVIKALKRIEKEGAGQLAESLKGPGQALKNFQNAWEDFSAAAGQSAQPALVALAKGFTGILNAAKKVQPAFAAFLQSLGKIINAFSPLTKLLADNGATWEGWGKTIEFVYKAAAVIANDLAYVIKVMANEIAYWIKWVANEVKYWAKQVGKIVGSILGAIDKGLSLFFGDAAKSSAKGMKGIVQNVANGIRKIRGLLAGIINATGPGFVSKMFNFDAGKFLTSGLGAAADGLEAGYNFGEGFVGGVRDYIDRINNLELPSLKPPGDPGELSTGLPGGSGDGDGKGGGKGKSSRGGNKRNKEQEEYNKLLKQATDLGLKAAGTIFDQLRGLEDQKRILEAKLNGNEREVRLAIAIRDATADLPPYLKKVVEERLRGLDALEQEVEAMEKLKDQADVMVDVWNGFGTEAMNVLDALIDGTEDWNAVLTDTLKSLSKVLLNAGLSALGGGDGQGFFSALTGGIGARADGGPVSAGRPYLVGEQGPELIVPRSSGTVIPNGAEGGSTVVNITVNEGRSSSSASGDDAQEAVRLARMVEASTMAVITRERRPGGLLTR